MNSEQFAYWLNGFIEINGDMPTESQWKSIKEHLKTVFNKVTPPINLHDFNKRNLQINPAPFQPFYNGDSTEPPKIIC